MLTITVNSTAAKDLLTQLSERLSDMTPAMAAIGATIETRVSARFCGET